MKTLFTLYILAIISLGATSYNEGKLTISVPSDQYTVTVNGRTYRVHENTVTLENLRSGEYNVRIYRHLSPAGSMRQNRETLYASTVTVRPHYHADLMMNRFGKVLFDEQPLRTRNNGRYEKDQGRNNGIAMNAQEFELLLKRVNEQRFGNDKMFMVREAAVRDQFHTGQVVRLMQLFSFENDRLEVARYCYASTIDKSNYHTVKNELRYASSRNELDYYIRNLR